MSNHKITYKLRARDMLRVTACAYLFLDSARNHKITRYAELNNIKPVSAAIGYTLSALKRIKARGQARNYSQALDILEAAQVGDRYNKITQSISADKLAHIINRINYINAGERITVGDTHYVRDYYNVTIVDGKSCIVPHFTCTDTDTDTDTDAAAAAAAAAASGKSVGKVVGTLYTEWEARTAELDIAEELTRKRIAELTAEEKQVRKNLKLFFRDYTARLSVTTQAKLRALVQSEESAEYLSSREGLSDEKTKKTANFAAHLFGKFPHKDCMPCREFIELCRKYIDV